MKIKAFLDTNIFIYAFEFKDCNSRLVIELLNAGRFKAITSEMVVKEIERYFERYHGHKTANLFRRFVASSCIIVPRYVVEDEMKQLKGRIKNKDLEHIAVVKHFGIKYLVSYDRDFEPFSEHTIPKGFVQLFGVKPKKTPY